MPVSFNIKKAPGPGRGGAVWAAFLLALLLISGCSSYKAEPLFDEAEKLLGEGSYLEAVDGYNRVINDFPRSSYAAKSQYRIAFIFNRHLKDRARAMEAYTSVRLMYPGSPEARLARAEMAEFYSLDGDHRKAIEEYQGLLDGSTEEKIRYQRAIAREYMKMNDFRQARIEFEELASYGDLPPGLLPGILFQIANTYYIGAQSDEAVERFDELIARYPGHKITLDARLGKGNALAEAGRLSEALAVLRGLEGEYPNKKALRTRIEWLEKRLKEGPEEH